MDSKGDMFNGRGFIKPSRAPRLDMPSKRKSQRPLLLWLGASALLGAGAFNLVTFVTGVVHSRIRSRVPDVVQDHGRTLVRNDPAFAAQTKAGSLQTNAPSG